MLFENRISTIIHFPTDTCQLDYSRVGDMLLGARQHYERRPKDNEICNVRAEVK